MTPSPSNPWALSRYGRAIDLVSPSPEDVDFAEIADTLANVWRWTGASRVPVSVAWHTVMGAEAAKDLGLAHIIPWWLLHDAHEARLGDIATPVAKALEAFARQVAVGMGHIVVHGALHRAKLTHDRAIHAAARLPLTDKDQRIAVKRLDAIMLMTERRDYLPDSPCMWDTGLEAIRPWRRPLPPPPPPGRCAEMLLALFREHLPVFTGAAPADGAVSPIAAVHLAPSPAAAQRDA